jgi:hypothetical protein
MPIIAGITSSPTVDNDQYIWLENIYFKRLRNFCGAQARLSPGRLSPVWHGSVSCSRSSNRTGASNASGSRRKCHEVAHGLENDFKDPNTRGQIVAVFQGGAADIQVARPTAPSSKAPGELPIHRPWHTQVSAEKDVGVIARLFVIDADSIRVLGDDSATVKELSCL